MDAAGYVVHYLRGQISAGMQIRAASNGQAEFIQPQHIIVTQPVFFLSQNH
jgi:hypothetical protein